MLKKLIKACSAVASSLVPSGQMCRGATTGLGTQRRMRKPKFVPNLAKNRINPCVIGIFVLPLPQIFIENRK